MSSNYFFAQVSNHLPVVTNKTLLLLGHRFKSATPFVSSIGTLNYASFKQDGTQVTTPKFPFEVSLVPSGAIDFSDSYQNIDWKDQLKTIPANTILYEVHGWDAPKELGGVEYTIGTLVT